MRRLIELRVFPDRWVLTPSFPERVIRLAYPFTEGCQSVLVAQSPPFYPVQLSAVRAYSIKPEKDVFRVLNPLRNGDSALAMKAIPLESRSQSAYCRVIVEVEHEAEQPPSSIDSEQNLLLAQHSEALSNLQAVIDGLATPPASEWIAADLGGRWENFGSPFPVAAYQLERGRVYLRGGIKSLSVAEIFLLPVGYRPQFDQRFPVSTSSFSLGDSIGCVSVGADGWVKYRLGYGDYFSLDGVCFSV